MKTRIIGVYHTFEAGHFSRLYEKIGELPERSKIGLELTRKDAELMHEVLRRKAFSLSFFLWAGAHSVEKGHQVIALDSSFGYRKHLQAKKKTKTSKNTEETEKSVRNEEVLTTLRSKFMLQRILKEKPDVAIVGIGHAREIEKVGLKVEYHKGPLWWRIKEFFSDTLQGYLTKLFVPKAFERKERIIQEMRKMVEEHESRTKD